MKSDLDVTGAKLASQPERRLDSLNGNLCRFLGERELLGVVLEAVQAVPPEALRSAPAPDFRPQMMLTLLTYAYAVGIYGSRDLEAATEYDRPIRYICARTFPDWRSIRSFRRRHRPLLEQCLAQVARQVWVKQLAPGGIDAKTVWELALRAEAAARERLDSAVLMDGAASD